MPELTALPVSTAELPVVAAPAGVIGGHEPVSAETGAFLGLLTGKLGTAEAKIDPELAAPAPAEIAGDGKSLPPETILPIPPVPGPAAVLITSTVPGRADSGAEPPTQDRTNGRRPVLSLPLPARAPSAAAPERDPTAVIPGTDAEAKLSRFVDELLPASRALAPAADARSPVAPAVVAADSVDLIAGLSAALAPGTRSPPAPAADAPLVPNQANFGEALANRVVWMLGAQTQSASLRLDPPQLGPLDVKITVKDGEASVQFSSLHGAVREAVQAALPQLRDMLAQQGLQLTNVHVSHHSLGEGRHGDGASADAGARGQTGGDPAETPNDTPPEVSATVAALGLIDYYI